MSEYYIGKNNERLGPFPLEKLISNGLTPDSLVWCQGMPGWKRATEVPEVAALFAPQPPAQPQYAPQVQDYQQQYGYQQPQYGYRPPRPDNNMVWAILSTILCCLPLGIVAIIKASNVNSLYDRGDYAGAEAAAKSAKSWAMWSAISAVVIWILYVLFIIVLGVGTATLSSYH